MAIVLIPKNPNDSVQLRSNVDFRDPRFSGPVTFRVKLANIGKCFLWKAKAYVD